MDLSVLKGKIVFAMNRAYLLRDKYPFIPTYYSAVNELVLNQFAEDVRMLDVPKFLNWRCRKLFVGDTKAIFVYTKYSINDNFTGDLLLPISLGGTVTVATLQIIYFMGFKKVVIIGLDHNFSEKGTPNKIEIRPNTKDNSHFHPNYFPPGTKWELPDLYRSELAYQQAKIGYENDGRIIIDATVEGKCNVFSKGEFKNHL